MSQPSESFLALRGLGKRFGEVTVLRDLNLALAEGEILALLGLSGSGKTTALRLVAGFETPDAGGIAVGGEDVTALSPARRGFGMVFQHYALFHHMSVAENIAFGLEARRWPRDKRAQRVAAMLDLVDLAAYGNRRIDAISGGQQQRVALARALAPEPRVLLLDEPLSNLDPALRERTRRELRAAVKAVGITTLLVTHEQEEAFDVGDRVAVLDRGRLAQLGTPQELYRRPTDRFVASFVGRAGSIRGTVATAPVDPAGGKTSDDTMAQITVAAGVTWQARAVAPASVGEPVELLIRPEALDVVDASAPGALAGTVTAMRFTGPLTYAVVELEMAPGVGSGTAGAMAGGTTEGRAREDRTHVEVAVGPTDHVEPGDRIGIAPGAVGPVPTVFGLREAR